MVRLKPLALLSGVCLLVVAGLALSLWSGAGIGPGPAKDVDLPAPERSRGDEPAAEPGPLASKLEGAPSSPTESGRTEAMLQGMGEVFFRGRVVRRGNESPISGARIEVLQGKARRVAVSDAQGGFEVSWAPRTPGTLTVSHPDFVALRRPDLPDPARSDSAEWVILLNPGSSIHGRLVGPGADTSMPAVARVRCWLGNSLPQEAMAEVEVSADGRFRFESLLPGTYAVTVHKQGAPPALATATVLSGQPTDVAVTIQRGIDLTVRMEQSTDGAPIPGAEVDLHMIQRGRDHPLQGITRPIEVTGAGGEALFRGVAEGSYRYYIRVPWGVTKGPLFREISEDTTPAEWVVTIAPPARLSGRVLDQKGEGAAGRVVRCVQGNTNKIGGRRGGREAPPGFPIGPGTMLDTVVTDGQGRFEFEALPSNSNLALMTMPPQTRKEGVTGAAVVEIVRLATGEIRTGLVLPLQPAFELRGTVEGRSELPLAGASVTATMRGDNGNLNRRATTSNEDGTFVLHDVSEGSYWLRVTREGYSEGRVDADVHGDLEGLDVVLEATSGLSGVVVDPTGWGVRNAIVTARRPSGRGVTRAVGDEYGQFTLEQMSAHEWTISAQAPGFSPSTDDAVTCRMPFGGELTLVLPPEVQVDMCRLLGTVVISGSGLPPEDMQFSGFKYREVKVAGSRFELSGPAVKRADLKVSSSNAETVHFSVPEIAAGDSVNLGLAETRPTVEVRVLVTDGTNAPLRGAVVFLERAPGEPVLDHVYVPTRIFVPRLKEQPGWHAQDGVGMYKWRLVIRHTEWQTLTTTVEVTDEANTFRVSLDKR
ncbi:MAG TPA: carboxypeptidase regulatory-like domain-containing protein [Planctomycetes bacterium]|nr:carboxypeptidase regulatory-like domain-containing protein [Planctomycetota bacterium]HIK60024.1 carboxypeptidase regulatory-like domain-containing protein [Planctomycetota bacterium]